MTPLPIVLVCGPAGSGKDTVAGVLVERYGAVRLASADPMKVWCKDMGWFSDEQLWGPSERREEKVRIPYPGPTIRQAAALKLLDTMGVTDLHVEETLDDWVSRWYGESRLTIADNALRTDGISKKESAAWSNADQPMGISARVVLQQLGTEWGRANVGPSCWVDTAVRTALRLLEGGWDYAPQTGPTHNPEARPVPFCVIADGRFTNEIIAVKRARGIAVQVTGRSSAVIQTPGHRSETELATVPAHLYDAVITNDGTLEDLEVTVRDLVSVHFAPSVHNRFSRLLRGII